MKIQLAPFLLIIESVMTIASSAGWDEDTLVQASLLERRKEIV
jgi:hypothetical protein